MNNTIVTSIKDVNAGSLEHLLRDALMAASISVIVTREDDQDEARIAKPDGREEFLLVYREERHGRQGYCVRRYTPYGELPIPSVEGQKHNRSPELVRRLEWLYQSLEPGGWYWDEWNQFYDSLDAMVAAVKTGDYEPGRREF